MTCKRKNEDLISLNQKLLTEKNLCTERKYPVEQKKTGWKVFDTKKDDLKNHLISQTVVRENKNTLDFANKAVNPAVYPNINLNDISDSVKISPNDEPLLKSDEILENINRDSILDDYQDEKQETLRAMTDDRKETGGTFETKKQKSPIIAQIRNYLTLVKNATIREKLELLLKYLHNTHSTQELTINNHGNFQKGLFDTQTKFSEYLSYYVLPKEEQRHNKKPPFYDVLIQEPLNEYLDSVVLQKTSSQSPKKLKSEPLEESTSKKTYKREKNVIPLRNIKDSDLRLQLTLPKLLSILDGLNIEIDEKFDNEAVYNNMISIIGFPMYAAVTGQKEKLKKEDYLQFCKTLKEYLLNG